MWSNQGTEPEDVLHPILESEHADQDVASSLDWTTSDIMLAGTLQSMVFEVSDVIVQCNLGMMK